MKLEELWQKSAAISKATPSEAAQKYALEEAFQICDSVRESVDRPSLSQAAAAVVEILSDTKWALCGGLAVGVWTEPRATKDIDVLTTDRSNTITKLLQSHQFSVGVIDVLDIESKHWNLPKQVALQALKTAVSQRAFGRRVLVVAPAGLIAMKLGRAITKLQGARQDQVDILNILRKHGYQDLSAYDLTITMKEAYQQLVAESEAIQDQPPSDDGIVGH